jgi:hypothetical protein
MGGSAKKQIVGYKYRLGFHLIFCLRGIKYFRKLRISDKTDLWSGNVTSNQTLTIDKPTIFGGDEVGGRGGFSANVDVMFGEDDQAPNSYLAALAGSLNPAYRRRFGMVFRGITGGGAYVGNTNSLDAISALLGGADDDYDWNPSLRWIQAADLDYPDINPAHIYRDLLLSSDIGIKANESDIDDDNFTAAAQKFYDEGMGISMLFTSPADVESHVAEVARHTNSILYQDQTTGKWNIKLLRDDYSLTDLIVIDESNSKCKSFSRAGIGELYNRVVITYHDLENNLADSVAVDDLALIDRHGGAQISKEIRYDGISSKLLAQKVGARDLKQLSVPLAKVSLDINREASSLRPGDVILWSNEEHGIVDMPLRIFKMSYGKPKSNHITAECTEDVFSYGTAVYSGSNGDDVWSDPVSDPADVTNYSLQEVPYFFYYDSLGGIPAEATATQGEVLILAEKETQTDLNYGIMQRIGVTDYKRISQAGDFCAVGRLVSDVTESQTTIELYDYDFTFVEIGGPALIGNEIVRVDSVNSDTGEVFVGRGCADTVCKTHAYGSTVFFFGNGAYGIAADDYEDSDSVDIKLLPRNGLGELDSGDATELTITMSQRANRPYPPGKMRLNTAQYPAAIMDDLVISWAHRDRTSQLADLDDETIGDIGPESTVTYTLRIYNESGSLVRTETGLTGTTCTWSTEEADSGLGRLNNTIRVKLKSVRSGLDSHQEHDYTFDRADWGYSWGEYWGGY